MIKERLRTHLLFPFLISEACSAYILSYVQIDLQSLAPLINFSLCIYKIKNNWRFLTLRFSYRQPKQGEKNKEKSFNKFFVLNLSSSLFENYRISPASTQGFFLIKRTLLGSIKRQSTDVGSFLHRTAYHRKHLHQ